MFLISQVNHLGKQRPHCCGELVSSAIETIPQCSRDWGNARGFQWGEGRHHFGSQDNMGMMGWWKIDETIHSSVSMWCPGLHESCSLDSSHLHSQGRADFEQAAGRMVVISLGEVNLGSDSKVHMARLCVWGGVCHSLHLPRRRS